MSEDTKKMKFKERKKSKVVAGLLGIFLGAFGIHNFYIGKYLRGTLLLIFTLLLFLAEAPYELIIITTGMVGLIKGMLILFNAIDINREYRLKYGSEDENIEFAVKALNKFGINNKEKFIDYVSKRTNLSSEDINEIIDDKETNINEEKEKKQEIELLKQQLQEQELSKQEKEKKEQLIDTNPNYHYIELDGKLKSSMDIINEIKSQSSNIGELFLLKYSILQPKEMADFNSRDEYNSYISEFEKQSDIVWEEIILELESEGYYCEYKDIYPNKEDYEDYLLATSRSIFRNQKLYEEEEFRIAKQEQIEKQARLKKQQRQEKILKSLDVVDKIISIPADLGESFVKDMNRRKYGDKVDNMTVYEIYKQNEKDKIIEDLSKKKK